MGTPTSGGKDHPRRRRCSLCGRAEEASLTELDLVGIFVHGALGRACSACRAAGRTFVCDLCRRECAGQSYSTPQAGLRACAPCASRIA